MDQKILGKNWITHLSIYQFGNELLSKRYIENDFNKICGNDKKSIISVFKNLSGIDESSSVHFFGKNENVLKG